MINMNKNKNLINYFLYEKYDQQIILKIMCYINCYKKYIFKII